MKHAILLFCLLLLGPVLHAGNPARPSQVELVETSPIIAVVEIRGAKPPRMNNASTDLSIFKQRATATTTRILKGNLPGIFVIENEADSVLTDGLHLAFLRPLADSRFVLSGPTSLRRVKDGEADWFRNEYVPIDEIATQIRAGER